MGWNDSGVNWLNPAANTPIWPVAVELANAINERHKLSNAQDWYNAAYPLIAITEVDDHPTSNASSGNRQYKMYEYAKYPYRPFVGASEYSPLGQVAKAMRNEMCWNYGRTDITDYTIDDAHPRPITELSYYGFPQSWNESKPGGFNNSEWVDSKHPEANNILTRMNTNDVSLYDANGYVKKEVITDLFNICKAFKYMFFNRFRDLSGNNTGVQRKRVLFNEDKTTFNAAWAVTPDEVLNEGGASLTIVSTTGTLKTALCYNSEIHNKLGEHGFTTVPNLVTTPRIRIVQGGAADDVPPEGRAVGYYDVNTHIIDGTTLVGDLWITADGQTPNSLTIPPEPEDWRVQQGNLTYGSGGTKTDFCFDLTTSIDLEYTADGS